jgi:hypothetical protein
VEVPADRDRVIGRRYYPGRQRLLNLLHQGPQVGLRAPVLFQQVR